jgi:hypothetical protein
MGGVFFPAWMPAFAGMTRGAFWGAGGARDVSSGGGTFTS